MMVRAVIPEIWLNGENIDQAAKDIDKSLKRFGLTIVGYPVVEASLPNEGGFILAWEVQQVGSRYIDPARLHKTGEQ